MCKKLKVWIYAVFACILVLGILFYPVARIHLALINTREFRSHEEFQKSVEDLSRYGPKVVPYLVPWLDDEASWRQDIAQGVLGKLGENAADNCFDLAKNDSTPLEARKQFLIFLSNFLNRQHIRDMFESLAKDTKSPVNALCAKLLEIEKTPTRSRSHNGELKEKDE